MPALISPRLLLFGESLSFHKFPHVSRNAWFHRSVCSLSLASLGFKNDHETVETGKFNEAKLLNSLTEVPKSKAKVVRSHVVKAAGPHRSLEIDSTIFNAKSFFELGLPPLLIERLEKEGFKTPTDVQATAIPTILKDHDVVIQSYTGSGKTLAYLLPILSEVGPLKTRTSDGDGDGEPGKKTDIEAVIVAPSRELGMQIVREFEKILGPANKKVVQQLVGGANRSRQEEALRKNKPCIVVGTPGRISEISAAGKLHTHGCRFLVLDEVDQLLSFNFREDMHRILEHVGRKSSGDSRGPKGSLAKRAERQTVLVSATVPFSVIRAARSWGTIHFSSKPKNSDPSSNVQTQAAIQSLPPSLKHYYCVTKLQHKVDTLRRCVHALDAKSVIVFMNHTKQLKDTVFKLEARGMIAAELHGDLGKLGRTTTLKKFKNGEVRILVTNELSARGLDVAECDLVVNLDLPTDSIHYAHRAGRTGRLGRKGTVVTICEESEVFVVKKLQRQLSVPIATCEFTEGKFVITEEEKALPALR
ncbi:DEAD-box ATP-dependent RNA helicase 47A [Prunus yedoensis var. nudiflora]|uniref:RNA helicase n=1 Tax=Prunus yedoensis var. nudiflora TaxID=2094558 RepID=A0A314ZFE0_PRUYE|nr:DEAD-box ATP-dependent RNA helicase 47A [Prunus yedoensis var. nudiflora]